MMCRADCGDESSSALPWFLSNAMCAELDSHCERQVLCRGVSPGQSASCFVLASAHRP